MAAFSSFQHPLHLLESSVFLPSSPPSATHMMCALLEEPNSGSSFFAQSSQADALQNLDQSTQASGFGNNELSVLSAAKEKSTVDSSSAVPDKKRKSKRGSSANYAHFKGMREVEGRKQRQIKDCEGKKKKSKEKEKAAAAAEAAPAGYVHVRARRGQATDSHSRAERVRREKISERMKLLQALVPGCDKVTGKALVLDEIINYVHSLQNQVEFLSRKLASVNPMFYDFGTDLESSFMVRPDQNLSTLPSPLEGMQQCMPTTANAYPLLDNTVNPLLIQQPQIPSDLPQQGHRPVLWAVDDQRQKIVNQSGITDSLLPLHQYNKSNIYPTSIWSDLIHCICH